MRRRTALATLISGILFWIMIPKHKTQTLFRMLRKSPEPSNHVLETAARIAEYIYPEDDIAGALSLGIKKYLTIHFHTTGYYKKHIPALIRLTKFLDTESKSRWSTDFVSAPKEVQEELITHIATYRDGFPPPSPQTDFHTLIDITMEGCFSDPMHGGNTNYRGWEVMKQALKKEWFDA